LARSYGVAAAPPGQQIEQLRRKYDALQARAKASKLGAWGGARGNAVADLSSKDEPEAAEANAGSEDLVAKVWASSALLFEPVEELPDSSLETTVVQAPVEEVPEAAVDEKPGVTKDGKVDLNHATAGELQTLPGIDAVTAEAIVAARPLAGFHELLRIPGITPATLREIFPLIVE
jgi:DNA uptake protein ComE-like DNA-binding protein